MRALRSGWRQARLRGMPLAAALWLAAAVLLPGKMRAQEIVSDKQYKEEVAGFNEFTRRVQSYVTLHKTAETSLETLKPTDSPELIAAHQQALARKIREARPNAKPGDIFTQNAAESFRHAIRGALQGTASSHAKATLEQSKSGARVKEMHLRVNEAYPDGVPYTTVPPTLLMQFPHLPEQVEYRIVGRDLIVIDVKANLVIDLLHEIFPKGFGQTD